MVVSWKLHSGQPETSGSNVVWCLQLISEDYFCDNSLLSQMQSLPIRGKWLMCGPAKSFTSNGEDFSRTSDKGWCLCRCQQKPPAFVSLKAHNRHLNINMCCETTFFFISVNTPVITSGWCCRPNPPVTPAHARFDLQVQPRLRLLEYRCSTLEQPPQWSVSGGDGRVPVRRWRTWWLYRREYCGEVL